MNRYVILRPRHGQLRTWYDSTWFLRLKWNSWFDYFKACVYIVGTSEISPIILTICTYSSTHRLRPIDTHLALYMNNNIWITLIWCSNASVQCPLTHVSFFLFEKSGDINPWFSIFAFFLLRTGSAYLFFAELLYSIVYTVQCKVSIYGS